MISSEWHSRVKIMPVSKDLVLELQQIIKEEYDRDISLTEASEIANGLVGYFDLLAKIDSRNKNEEQLLK